MKTTLESKPPGVRKAAVEMPAGKPGVRDYSGVSGGREKAAARPKGGKAAAALLLVALLWLSLCPAMAQTTNAPGTRSNAWTGFSTNAPGTKAVAGTSSTTNSPSERSTGWVGTNPVYPLLNSAGEVVAPTGFWESNSAAIAALGLVGGSANPNAITNGETRLLNLYGGFRLLSPSMLNYWTVTNDVVRERLTFQGEGGSEVSFVWSDGKEGLEAKHFYGGLDGASNLPPSGVVGLPEALNGLTNHMTSISNSIVVPRNIFVFDGDSLTDNDTWSRYFTNGTFAKAGVTIRATNVAVSSDGLGYGHPDNIDAMTYKAISSISINASGLATATMTGYDWSWQTIRKFIVRSSSVSGLLGYYTISTPVYSAGNTTFTFQTTLGAQTITDARIENGAISRYAPLVRPNKPGPGQTGYYFIYVGLNDGGRVYQSGDLSGLWGVGGGWCPAFSNLVSCAHADGFKVVAFTQHFIKSSWASAGRSGSAAMNEYIRTARDASGQPLVDYLVDLEQLLVNPWDQKYFDSYGLHLTDAGYQLMASEVTKALTLGNYRGQVVNWTNEVHTLSPGIFMSKLAPENYLIAPVGTLFVNRGATDYRSGWMKTTGTGSTGWEPIPTGKATNSWPGSNYFGGPITADVLSVQSALRLGQLASIPTNGIPPNSTTSGSTNWFLVNIGGVPKLIATNYAAGGWIEKAL